MTPFQKQRQIKKREKIKAQRLARKLRKEKMMANRKTRQAIRMAPKKALAAWSVQIRSCGFCAVCGPSVKHPVLHAHHLLPKERFAQFKFVPINGIALCPLHHKFGTWSAHRHPIWFVIWLRRHRPEQFAWARENMGREGTIVKDAKPVGTGSD